MRVMQISDPIWLGEEAKRMARELILDEHRGAGDTIEAAAYRIETERGCPAEIILQGWNRPAREWKVSRWMTLFFTHYETFAGQAKAAYEEKRNEAVGCHPALLCLADLVAGHMASRPSQDEAEISRSS